MITFSLFLALASLGNLYASGFDLSRLNQNDSNNTPIIRKSTKIVRLFGASQVNQPFPQTTPLTAVPLSIVSPSSAGTALAPGINLRPVPAANVLLNREPATKRSRIESDGIDESTRRYISNEGQVTSFKKLEKRIALQKAIEFIALNDYVGYAAYEPEFEAVFGHKYHLFKRGPNRADYMMHYIIRFGATNFLKCYAFTSRTSDNNSKIEEAFEHLIATKPIEVVLKFIVAKKHLGVESVRKAVSNAVKKRYPDLHFLDYIVFESNVYYEYALKIFEAESEEEKFARFTDFLKAMGNEVNQIIYCSARLLEIPFRYQEYFMGLDLNKRLFFAKAAIIYENIEALSKIFEIDSDLAVDTSENTLFAYAVAKQNANIIRFFMDVVPELATYEEYGKPSPLAISVLEGYTYNLKAFEDCGIDLTQQISYKRTLMTPIKLAFDQRMPKTFFYLVRRFGGDYANEQLLQFYGTKNEIMCHALRPIVSFGLAEILRDNLGFDFNDQYHFGSKSGNALIFVDENDYLRESFKKEFIKEFINIWTLSEY